MPTMQGPLLKWTNMMKGYQQRWFVLDEVNGLLSYYTSQEKLIRGDRRGCIRLKNALLGIEDDDDTVFTITSDGMVFHCKAIQAETRDQWLSCLQSIIVKLNQRRRPLHRSTRAASVEEFNRKLSETDAYLQLLIGQLNKIEDKITLTSDTEERAKLVLLKNHSVYLLDSIKHTIVLLQIAKNIKYPVNGVFSGSGKESINHQTSLVISEQDRASVVLDQCSISKPSESRENKWKEDSKLTSINSNVQVEVAPVPDISYTSSDDEDFFFDANDESVLTLTKSPSESSMKAIPNATDPIDYDKIYESDDEDDMNAMQPHGNVITHLLSQVKIGMDLTKVALPTYILERRSLLEMYADFFAHADLFVSIPDYKTPQDRMIQVVKWYLSAFHAGRKGSVAKKPYNPVLGEMFKCYWNLPGKSSQSCNEGPVPWAKTGDLTFVAEQVSHHPPISAFYAECIDKRIMCSAYIWTKSKFLGISIGVNNVGQGSIYLLDHGEEYTCTFPNAYGRSILTEPWFELGGQVDIVCHQTGYSARVDFLTKPFYGNKKHKVNVEVHGPLPTKKLIATITGEWNGQMEVKWAQGEKNELFIDTKTMPIIKKQVLSVSKQEYYESRKFWLDVTAALKRHDVNQATEAKCNIEQRQRDLVKERDQNSVKWENRMFHTTGDKWYYNYPLTNRKP